MAAAAGALAGKELFKKAVGDLYDSLVGEAKRKIKEWNTERKIDKLYEKMSQVRMVKTIWQMDKAVDLADFYCDSRVLLGDEKQMRTVVRQLSDFGTKDNVLIEGIAGQGKSIFLRYLCYTELIRGEYIPLFVELRRIGKSHSLKDRIEAAFQALDLPVDDTLFAALAASGKIVLLLDAFDEIPEDLKASVVTEIEDLASVHENLRIVITSRPDQGIKSSPHFNVVPLGNLRDDEYVEVISKLGKGEDWSQNLTSHIDKTAPHLKEMLCTPLMVTLLVLSYKSYKKLPDRLSDFYDALFQTLLQRHDGTKPGFSRERACDLDDTQYRRVFEALCILTKKADDRALDTETIRSLTEDALKKCALVAPPAAYIDDIVKITCLLLREGDEHRFIHKTVQEYYTASFIRRKPEPWAEQFYGRIRTCDAPPAWGQELAFLSEIDTYRCKKYYVLPEQLEFLGMTEEAVELGENTADAQKCASIALDDMVFLVTPSGQWGYVTPVSGRLWELLFRRVKNLKKFETFDEDVRSGAVPSSEFGDGHSLVGLPTGTRRVSGADLLENPEWRAVILDCCRELLDGAFALARSILASTKENEDASLLDGLV